MAERQLYIGELAKRAGVNPKTIRYYEQIGLIAPTRRTASGYRLYQPEDAKRLGFIKKAQALGLSLEEIKEVLTIRDSGALPCEHVRRLLVQRLEALERYLKEMEAFRQEFAAYVAHLEERAKEGEQAEICQHIEGFDASRPAPRKPSLR